MNIISLEYISHNNCVVFVDGLAAPTPVAKKEAEFPSNREVWLLPHISIVRKQAEFLIM